MFVFEYKMSYGISICMQPLTSFIILVIPGFDFFPSLSLSQVLLFLHTYKHKGSMNNQQTMSLCMETYIYAIYNVDASGKVWPRLITTQ